MMLDLHSVARALGGEVAGNQVVCPGPGHSTKDRSLSVTLARAAPEGIVTYSHAGDDWRACREHVLSRLGVRSMSIGPSPLRKAKRPIVCTISPLERERRERALAIWAEATDPRGTAVEQYLRSRGLEFLGEAASAAIRFHSSCPFADQCTPAMVALVRDVVTNEPKAIHRTALNLSGEKITIAGKDRLALGPIAGGAIKLTPDEDVTVCLGVGEGIESTLSLQITPEFGLSPVWCLLSASGIAHLPVLPGIECLWIAVDHDEAGMRAARTATDRWCTGGAEVFRVKPLIEKADLNDLARRGHHA